MLGSELPSAQKFTGGVQVGTWCPERVSGTQVGASKWDYIGLVQFRMQTAWVRRAGLQIPGEGGPLCSAGSLPCEGSFVGCQLLRWEASDLPVPVSLGSGGVVRRLDHKHRSAGVGLSGGRETGLVAEAELSRKRNTGEKEGRASWEMKLPLSWLLMLLGAVPLLPCASVSPSENQQLN